MALTACAGPKENKGQAPQEDFNYVVDQFADLQILRYQVPGFESLSLKQKQLLSPASITMPGVAMKAQAEKTAPIFRIFRLPPSMALC